MISIRGALAFVLLGLSIPGAARAQAVTTAAIYGAVSGADSAAIEEAIVSVTNTATGERWQVSTRADGRYYVEYLSLGGPYTVEARAIGLQPASRPEIVLSLAERERVDFQLVSSIVTLPEIAVSAAADDRINPGRTGPAQTFTDTLISRLPIVRRNFYHLIQLSPQAAPSPAGGASIAGQNDRLNGLQIDGGSNNDLSGYAGGGGIETPGAHVRTLSVEAIRELQVATAPFDVRFGTFAAGLINAVTRSGSNRWGGLLSGYLEDQALTGKDEFGDRAQDFTTKELAFTLGGPIVRDRAAFFLDLGLQRELTPQAEPEIGTDTTGGADSAGVGIRYASVLRFQQILRDRYGFEAGTFDAVPFRVRGENLFAKLTLQPGVNNRIELSHNYGHGIPQFTGNRTPYSVYTLSSGDAYALETINATRLTWTASNGGRLSNELSLARLGVRESQRARSELPEVQVTVDEGSLLAGQPAFFGRSTSKQDLWELTDNLSWVAGDHQLTFGTHGELAHIRRLEVAQPLGHWDFGDLDSLEGGLANHYFRTVPNPSKPEGGLGDYRVNQIGVYVQDRWTPTPRLTLTAGLRLDVPYVPTSPTRNLALLQALGIDNTLTPSGNALWAPRLGVSYDLGGLGAFLRGGLGLFSGRPAYHWFNSVYQGTGLEDLELECFGSDVPAFTADPANQPTSCPSAGGPKAFVAYFNPDFRFPRNLRASLGADVRLPGGTIGTVDLIYIRGVSDFYVTDVNLIPTGVAAGEGGRILYGTFDASGQATPNRRSYEFERVNELRNARGDRSYLATVQLQKRFAGGQEIGLAYTYTDSKDRLSAAADLAVFNVAGNPLDGPIDDRRLRTSSYSVPHKVTVVGAVDLPLRARLAVFYIGYSGQPYTYVIQGDVDADRYTFNDIVYVPRDGADIALADPAQYPDLDRFIQSEPCLREQRGRLMRRNSCRDHWNTVVNARVSKIVPTARGQSIELIADLFNALNLFDRDWGVRRFVSNNELLELVGYDLLNGRGVYNVLPVDRNTVDAEATRWRVQVGARYTF